MDTKGDDGYFGVTPAVAVAPRADTPSVPAAPPSTVPTPAAPAGPSTPAAPATSRAPAQRIGGESSTADSTLLSDVLRQVLELGASDLHLTVGAPPTVRIRGHLQPLEQYPSITAVQAQSILYTILTQKQRSAFEAALELDFAFTLPRGERFRVNLFRQRDALGATFRVIPHEITPLAKLGMPPVVPSLAMLPRGFVLVTGPTGSGKSTTLASLVDLANQQRRDHIMTVEDPIEFLHAHRGCLVNQREVGEDTHSFASALKHVLRQDPDIIMVGELRDLETMAVALTAAETGHLVFATLHTQDAPQTIDRVIDVFPSHQQQQVRVQLAGALQAVVCQQLVKTSDGTSRAAASEVLIATPAIRNLIREGKTHQVHSSMQAGGSFGMVTMDQSLAELVKRGRITYEAAAGACHSEEELSRLAGRGGLQ